jgi:hypothetical protein
MWRMRCLTSAASTAIFLCLSLLAKITYRSPRSHSSHRSARHITTNTSFSTESNPTARQLHPPLSVSLQQTCSKHIQVRTTEHQTSDEDPPTIATQTTATFTSFPLTSSRFHRNTTMNTIKSHLISPPSLVPQSYVQSRPPTFPKPVNFPMEQTLSLAAPLPTSPSVLKTESCTYTTLCLSKR